MFQRFTSVSDGYTCFYVIMYSISMDSAYKPFYCKAATDFFFSSFSRCQCFMTARSLVLSESIFVYLRYWNKIPTAERRNSGLQASKEETEREERKNNTGEKRDFFIAILRCLFQCDICASFNRFSLQSRKLLMIAAAFSLFRIGARKLARIFKLCKFSLSNGLFICSKECGE